MNVYWWDRWFYYNNEVMTGYNKAKGIIIKVFFKRTVPIAIQVSPLNNNN